MWSKPEYISHNRSCDSFTENKHTYKMKINRQLVIVNSLDTLNCSIVIRWPEITRSKSIIQRVPQSSRRPFHIPIQYNLLQTCLDIKRHSSAHFRWTSAWIESTSGLQLYGHLFVLNSVKWSIHLYHSDMSSFVTLIVRLC